MATPNLTCVRYGNGTYRVWDTYLDREATVKSTSAAAALKRYQGILQHDHPCADSTIESMEHGNRAMTV